MIVVDAGAVTDALSCVAGSGALRALLATEELHAPDLLDHQVLAAVRALVAGGHLSPGRGFDLLTDLEDLPVRRWPSAAPLRLRALQLATTGSGAGVGTGQGTYVALAQALGCPVVTRDAALARAAGHLVAITVV